MSCLNDLTTEIYSELEPSDVSEQSISYWLSSNLGKLNNLLGTDFAMSGENVTPAWSQEQSDIYKLLYFISYYRRQMNRNLGAAGYSSISEVKEGNRTVRRTNKTEVAKSYQMLVSGYNEELEQQLMAYKINASSPHHFFTQNPILVEEAELVGGDQSTRNND